MGSRAFDWLAALRVGETVVVTGYGDHDHMDLVRRVTRTHVHTRNSGAFTKATGSGNGLRLLEATPERVALIEARRAFHDAWTSLQRTLDRRTWTSRPAKHLTAAAEAMRQTAAVLKAETPAEADDLRDAADLAERIAEVLATRPAVWERVQRLMAVATEPLVAPEVAAADIERARALELEELRRQSDAFLAGLVPDGGAE